MENGSIIVRIRRRGAVVAAAGTLAALMGSACAGDARTEDIESRADEARTGPSVGPPATAAQSPDLEFANRLDAYLQLRAELVAKHRPLEETDDAAELVVRQQALAAAIQEARSEARQGDLIPRPVATRIRAIVVADLRQRNPEAREASIDEVPDGVLTINRGYPTDAALPTVPPLLLMKLPPLPDNLQYRFVDRHVVILDGDTHIILDYVANVLPPH